MAVPAEQEGGQLYVVGIDLGGTAAKLGLVRCRHEPDDEASNSSVDDLLVHSLRVPLPAAVEERCVHLSASWLVDRMSTLAGGS